MKELKEYLKSLDCRNVPPAAHGSKVTDEAVVKDIEAAVDAVKGKKGKKKKCKMQVRPHLLFRVSVLFVCPTYFFDGVMSCWG